MGWILVFSKTGILNALKRVVSINLRLIWITDSYHGLLFYLGKKIISTNL
jgi:hypothetical protein